MDLINYMYRETNSMVCVPIEDSDQPGHPPSKIDLSLLCAIWVANDQ